MRSYIVFVLLLAMLVGFGFLALKQPRTSHAMPTARVTVDAGHDSAAPTKASEDAGPRAKMDRALKVTALGWDLLTAGVVENGGSTPGPTSGFTAKGIDVQLATSDSADKLESRLARGGAEAEGADIAVLPLPVYVASYERLRALEPEVILVVGWSRGREAVTARKAPFAPPSSSDPVNVVSAGADAPTMLALFSLDLAGVPLGRVRLIRPGDDAAAAAPLAAVDRSRTATSPAGERQLWLTTADATRLVPWVAVAPHALVEAHGPALTAWAEGWMQGVERLRKDVPAAARQVAAIDGSPETVVLLVGLGQFEPVTLRDNAELMGLSGRSAVTLERLFQTSWRLWREVGVLSTPSPDHAPLSTGIVAALARGAPGAAEPAHSDGANPSNIVSKSKKDAVALLSHAEPSGKLDEGKVVDDVGWIAGVFDRSPIRVSAAKGAAERVLGSAREQFALQPERLSAGQVPLRSASALIDVLRGE